MLPVSHAQVRPEAREGREPQVAAVLSTPRRLLCRPLPPALRDSFPGGHQLETFHSVAWESKANVSLSALGHREGRLSSLPSPRDRRSQMTIHKATCPSLALPE